MFEGAPNLKTAAIENVDSKRINELDEKIADILLTYERLGLPVARWNDEYEQLPQDLEAFETFYDRLFDFKQQREDALTTIEFTDGISEEEKSALREFDSQVRRAYKDSEHFLGNGASAEVYGMSSNDTVCVKFITNQEQYDQNNHMRVEFDLLSHVYEHTKQADVRTPYPIFLRMHTQEGHSFGMEKIPGASLSQLLEFPDRYPELLAAARAVDQDAAIEALLDFVAQMHNAGVTHCDLYKRNIMLDGNGNFYVIDFGKAKREGFIGEREAERTSDVYNARQSLRDFFINLSNIDK